MSVPAICASALALTAAPAQAGDYASVSCGEPYPFEQGASARNAIWPSSDRGFGWTNQSTYSQGGKYLDCSQPTNWPLPFQPQGIQLALDGVYTQSGGARSSAIYRLPTGVTISRYALRFNAFGMQSGFLGPNGSYGDLSIYHQGQTDPTYDWRRTGTANEWQLSLPVLDVTTPSHPSWVAAAATCGGRDQWTPCPGGYVVAMAALNIMGSQFALEDNTAPQISNVSGDLVATSAWRGTVGVSAQITDTGSGVQSIIVQRRAANGDWDDLSTQAVTPGDLRCRPVANARVWQIPAKRIYTSPSPCRNDASGDLDVDTNLLPEGPATLRVQIEDAAANRSTLVGARQIIIDRTAPSVSWANTPTTCTQGDRVNVRPTVADAGAGVDQVTVTVRDKDGAAVPVAVDGTILCPAPGSGPLTVSVSSTDKAGNMVTETRPGTVGVTARPVDPPKPPEDKAPFGGGRDVTPTPDPTPAPVASPGPIVTPVVPRTDGTSALLACSRQRVVLTEVYPTGAKDVLRGAADPKYVNQTVTIKYLATGATTTAQVQPDGSFSRVVNAPKGRAAKGERGRYQASIQGEKSLPLKRWRRMYTDKPYRAVNGAGVYVSGSVTKPYKVGATVTIRSRARSSCSDWSHVVGRATVSRSGKWGALLPLSGGTSVVLRAETTVKKTGRSHRRMRTMTLPNPVQLAVG